MVLWCDFIRYAGGSIPFWGPRWAQEFSQDNPCNVAPLLLALVWELCWDLDKPILLFLAANFKCTVFNSGLCAHIFWMPTSNLKNFCSRPCKGYMLSWFRKFDSVNIFIMRSVYHLKNIVLIAYFMLMICITHSSSACPFFPPHSQYFASPISCPKPFILPSWLYHWLFVGKVSNLSTFLNRG